MLGREKEGDMGGQGEKNVGGEKGHGFLEGDGGGEVPLVRRFKVAEILCIIKYILLIKDGCVKGIGEVESLGV